MPMNRRSRWVAFIGAALLAVAVASGQGQLRRAKVGDKLSAFTLTDIEGNSFSYQQDTHRVLAVVFLAAHQTRSERAIVDLNRIAADLQRGGHPLDLVSVVSDSEDLAYFRQLRKDLGLAARILLDREDHLWGKLGLTATPTVIVADPQGVIRWIRAGHGYDFSEQARSEVLQTLGLEPMKETEHTRVEALTNDTPEDRASRHMRMGQALDSEGRLESAITELRKAQELAPRSVEVQLELGRLLCRAGQSEEAAAVAGRITATAPAEEAEVKMLLGWARRQLGDRDQAEKMLSESVRLNPKSVRALYELGKLYRERGDNEKAIEAYDRALAVHFREPPSSPGGNSRGGVARDASKGEATRPHRSR
jgi:tetratricopeptide (TPR) repeat protein